MSTNKENTTTRLKLMGLLAVGLLAGPMMAGAANVTWHLQGAFDDESGPNLPPDVAVGGLTWRASPNVQPDAYGLGGLTPASTDLAAGCGISVFVK